MADLTLSALAGALILPLDRLREHEIVEGAEEAPRTGAPERPVYPTVGHSFLCVNAVAVGAVTASWFWSKNLIEGRGCDAANERWGQDFANATYEPMSL